MKKLFIVFATMVLAATSFAAEDDREKVLDRVQSAGKVLDEIMSAPDKGIPEEILGAAECVAVVPSMIKGGFVVGARYGRGVATCRKGTAWTAPAPFVIEGGSWGLQIGGQAVDLVMLIMNERGMQQLLSSKFKIGADASAAAGPVGRHAEGSTDWKLRSEVLTYSRARGAFAGITLNGAVVKQDDDSTKELYGRVIPFNRILKGNVPPPAGTQSFLTEVARRFRQARSDNADKSTASKQSGDTTAERHTAPSDRGTSSSSTATTGGTSGTATASDREGDRDRDTSSAGSVSSQSDASTASGSNAGMTRASTNGEVKDQIERAFRSEPGLSASTVRVTVTEDAVQLTGSVGSASDKASILRIAEQYAGGRKINDRDLVVK